MVRDGFITVHVKEVDAVGIKRQHTQKGKSSQNALISRLQLGCRAACGSCPYGHGTGDDSIAAQSAGNHLDGPATRPRACSVMQKEVATPNRRASAIDVCIGQDQPAPPQLRERASRTTVLDNSGKRRAVVVAVHSQIVGSKTDRARAFNRTNAHPRSVMSADVQGAVEEFDGRCVAGRIAGKHNRTEGTCDQCGVTGRRGILELHMAKAVLSGENSLIPCRCAVFES